MASEDDVTGNSHQQQTFVSGIDDGVNIELLFGNWSCNSSKTINLINTGNQEAVLKLVLELILQILIGRLSGHNKQNRKVMK